MNHQRVRLGIVILTTILALAAPQLVLARSPNAAGSLADAYRIITTKRFVDLTHTFSPTTPVWKGFGSATFVPTTDPASGRPYTIANDDFRTFTYTIVGQYGTHVDPPAHFATDGQTLDQIPL